MFVHIMVKIKSGLEYKSVKKASNNLQIIQFIFLSKKYNKNFKAIAGICIFMSNTLYKMFHYRSSSISS